MAFLYVAFILAAIAILAWPVLKCLFMGILLCLGRLNSFQIPFKVDVQISSKDYTLVASSSKAVTVRHSSGQLHTVQLRPIATEELPLLRRRIWSTHTEYHYGHHDGFHQTQNNSIIRIMHLAKSVHLHFAEKGVVHIFARYNNGDEMTQTLHFKLP